jgi:hypothetical protein
MPQEPKRPVSELKPAELRTIVGNIQKLLWLDNEEGDGPEFWNAEKEWECADLLSFIATELENAGLKPIDPPTVIGFDSVDEFLEALPKTPPADFDGQRKAALLNTPVDEQVLEYDDVSDSEDPEDWTSHAKASS